MLTRCDLHLHSSASDKSEEWFPKHFGCPESYADPIRQYELCKARGMTFVTLTDHDTIAGGLRLLDRPDFFLSEEVTARFPENECVVHVLAWNITPEQHQEIQLVRGDVYALVDYLRDERIAHGLAHPFESPNRKLDAKTLERLMLLFSTFEVANGRTEERLNGGIRALLAALDAQALKRLSLRHSLPPALGIARRPAVTAGSDDHEHPRAATCYTEVDDAESAHDFLRAVMAGEARAFGRGADVIGLGLAFGGTAYRFLETLAADGGRLASPFADLMDAITGRLDPAQVTSAGQREFIEHVQRIVRETASPRPGRTGDLAGPALGDHEGEAREIANAQIRTCDALLRSGVGAAVDALQSGDFFGLFGALRDVAGGMKAMVPFLFAADHLGRQVGQLRALGQGWSVTPWPTPPRRLAIFADTLSQVDGVSIWCRRFLDRANRDGTEVVIPHCGPVSEAVRDPQTAHFFRELPETGGGSIPVYQGLRLAAPSLVHTLAFLQQERITEVELATPGPFGAIGLLAAKMLRIRVTATYHTEVPGLVRLLTGSERFERWACTYLRWFYGQVELVTAFSRAAAERVRALGVPEARIDLRPLAVDPTEFSPAQGRGPLALDLPADRPIVLSVGRLSPEKNLPLIFDAMARLHDRLPRPLLVVAGDGPDRSRLEDLARGRNDILLVGAQTGLALRQLYARAAAFVFASEVDTLGLVAMEAMSSGTPLIAPRSANIAELLEHRRSAYLTELDPAALAAALREVLGDHHLASLLSHHGRARMVARWREASVPRAYQEPALA